MCVIGVNGTSRVPPTRSTCFDLISLMMLGMVVVSIASTSASIKPSITAMSVPWPRPVLARLPKRSTWTD